MARFGRSASERRRRECTRATALPCALALMVLLCSAMATAAPDPKADPKGKKDGPAEAMPAITQLTESQQALAASVAQLREQLSETERVVTDLRNEMRDKGDAGKQVVDQILDQVEGMRREVWGLYVESSGLKGDIAQTGKQVDGLDQSLGSFRSSVGIVVAIVIVLQVVLVGLTFRGRG